MQLRAREIINFARNDLNINQFIAHCDSENIASIRAMEKLESNFQYKSNGRENKISQEDRYELKYGATCVGKKNTMKSIYEN